MPACRVPRQPDNRQATASSVQERAHSDAAAAKAVAAAAKAAAVLLKQQWARRTDPPASSPRRPARMLTAHARLSRHTPARAPIIILAARPDQALLRGPGCRAGTQRPTIRIRPAGGGAAQAVKLPVRALRCPASLACKPCLAVRWQMLPLRPAWQRISACGQHHTCPRSLPSRRSPSRTRTRMPLAPSTLPRPRNVRTLSNTLRRGPATPCNRSRRLRHSRAAASCSCYRRRDSSDETPSLSKYCSLCTQETRLTADWLTSRRMRWTAR